MAQGDPGARAAIAWTAPATFASDAHESLPKFGEFEDPTTAPRRTPHKQAAVTEPRADSSAPKPSAPRVPPPKRNLVPWLAGGAVLVAGAGVALYYGMHTSGEAAPTKPGPDAAVVAIDAPAAVDAPAAAPSIDASATDITIRVSSNPPGATVLLDGKKLGKTPLEVKMPHSSVTVELKIRRDGYASKRVNVTLDKDVEVTATLKRE